ncbi:MAG: prephenate dehydrogenase/arogenate dehydrogenase family protein [Gemmatimonadaceae bacterium]
MAPLGLGPVAVIGLGAIGGSVAKALVLAGARVQAYAESAADADAARRGGIEVSADIPRCVAGLPVIVLAVPVRAHAAVAAAVVDAASTDAVVLHTASLQTAAALAAAGGLPYGPDVARRVLGSHPLAGSHRAGFAAADARLFAGCVVSTEARADTGARAIAERLWRAAGAARIDYRTADEHDELMTWVSHLPQLASTALAHAIASSGVAASALGPGGRDATRLAASPFEMWSGILAGARPGAVRAATALERSVAALRVALETGDTDALETVWAAARAWREAADGAPAGAGQAR